MSLKRGTNMKKVKALLLSTVLLTMLFTIPSCKKSKKIERESEEEVIPIPSSEHSHEEGEESSSEEEVTVTAGSLKEEEFIYFPSYYLNKLNKYSSYKAVTSGTTHAEVFGMDVPQSIDATVIKGEYSYLKNESHSSLVNTIHEAYYHDKQAVYRDSKDGEYTSSSLDDYLDKYGVNPLGNNIEGYLLGSGCITSINREEVEGNYKFSLEFDIEKATTNVKIQMKKFGGLDDYPSFSSIKVDVFVKDDFSPVKIELDSKYKAKKIMDSDCHQTYTVTFSNFDETIEIPNLEEVKTKF